MFVIAVVVKKGAHRFIDGEDRELEVGYELRIDDVSRVWVKDEHIAHVFTWDEIYWTFDTEYWFISAVSERDPLFDA